MVNFFEAIGIERHEIRHSRFLAFLLNPKKEHGLGDLLLKCLLKKALDKIPNEITYISMRDLENISFTCALVQCECKHIDILIRDHNHKIVIIIENKIDTGEHDDQLARYWESIAQQYNGWRIIGLYLSPSGTPPSDERYLPISYDLISNVLEGILTDTSLGITIELAQLIRQYRDILCKHVIRPVSVDVLNPEAKAGTPTYVGTQYTAAGKGIHEQIDSLLESLITDAGLSITWSKPASKCSYIDFSYTDWIADTTMGSFPLGFEIANTKEGVELDYFIHRSADPDTKVMLLKMAHQRMPPFMPSRGRTNTKKSQSIYKCRLLAADELNGDWENIEVIITQRWQQFTITDLLRIKHAVIEHLKNSFR